jgi:hypothetical protein
MNSAVRADHLFEMARPAHAAAKHRLARGVDSLYFVVFGAATARASPSVEGAGLRYLIVPGLVMLSVLTQRPMPRLASISEIWQNYERCRRRLLYFEIVLG